MQDEVAHTLTENRVLQKSRHPFLTVKCILFGLESCLSLLNQGSYGQGMLRESGKVRENREGQVD